MDVSLSRHERLRAILGGPLAAYIAEGGDASLASATRLVELLLLHAAPATVRAWIGGQHPDLDGRSPAMLIRTGRFDEARAAVRDLLERA